MIAYTNAKKISHDGGCPSLNNTSGGSMVCNTEVTPGHALENITNVA